MKMSVEGFNLNNNQTEISSEEDQDFDDKENSSLKSFNLPKPCEDKSDKTDSSLKLNKMYIDDSKVRNTFTMSKFGHPLLIFILTL